ncbi:unnamed protein product, partial [Rotaria sp. Silwood2]
MYHSMDDYTMALSYYNEALTIKENSLPRNPASIEVTHYNLAKIYEKLDRCEEAVKHAECATSLAHEVFGPKHHETKVNQDYLDDLQRKV